MIPPLLAHADRTPRFARVSASSSTPGPGAVLRDLFDPSTDLTTNAAHQGAEAIGQRIVLRGRVLDPSGRPCQDTLVEVWQANSAGRYNVDLDGHQAPLDPNFHGYGRCFTDEDGWYEFLTIKPGPYPVPGGAPYPGQSALPERWRPAHVHFSAIGPRWPQRLVTQMYFPGDPLHDQDVTDILAVPESLRGALIARFDPSAARSGLALGYRFDVLFGGAHAVAHAAAGWDGVDSAILFTPVQSPGPYMRASLATTDPAHGHGRADGDGAVVDLRLRDGAGQPVEAMLELWRPGPEGGYWSRVVTDRDGHVRVRTPAAAEDASFRPLDLIIFARGLPYHLVTRMYFADTDDRLLDALSADRRRTLLAREVGGGLQGYEFTINLQGDDETVFLDFDEPLAHQPASGDRALVRLAQRVGEVRAAAARSDSSPATVFRP